MTYELKPGQGSLFQNDRKESANHPDYNGTVNIDGTEYWISGWKKVPKAGGKPFLSLAIKPKEARGMTAAKEPYPNAEADTDIPF